MGVGELVMAHVAHDDRSHPSCSRENRMVEESGVRVSVVSM